ncbi:hypothetical protein [Arcanobacterium canis]
MTRQPKTTRLVLDIPPTEYKHARDQVTYKLADAIRISRDHLTSEPMRLALVRQRLEQAQLAWRHILKNERNPQ